MTHRADNNPKAEASSGVRRVEAALLATSIVAGGVLTWAGMPILSIWLVSELNPVQGPSALNIVLTLAIIAASFVALLKLLLRLNARYLTITSPEEEAEDEDQVDAWLRRAGTQRRAGFSLIEGTMVLGVIVALVVFFVWFFFYAETITRESIAVLSRVVS